MANTKVTSAVIADNAVGIDQLNVSDGTNGQVLTTNGSGTLSFSTISGYTDSDVETYLDTGTSTPTFASATISGNLTVDTNVLSVNSTSNTVGIGTAAGVQKLAVAIDDSYTDIASGYAPLELTNTNGTNGTYSRIYFNDAVSGAGSGIIGVKLIDTTNNYGQFEFWTRGSSGFDTRMAIEPNGNVGIGTTSPSSSYGFSRTLKIYHGTNAEIDLSQGTQTWSMGVTAGMNYNQTTSGNGYDWQIGGSSKMRIDSNGSVLIGTTGASDADIKLQVEGNETSGGRAPTTLINGTTDVSPALNVVKTSTTTTSSARFVQFYANTFNTPMGGIVGNGSSNVQFATLSDEREKENITPISGVLDKIMNLNVVSFDWKKNDEHVKAGFIAQNVEEHFPEYVMENVSNNNEEPRKGTTGGMSAGYIAVLTKAIQEQQTIIDDLKARIETLENA